MTAMHQLYCTHCTHGTSALAREQGPVADEPLGYSVRAASLSGSKLRETFGRVEPYLHYKLPPSSATGAVLETPKRLFLTRLHDGTDLLGQVSYRDTDTTGRPGSYFAHLLVSDHPQDGKRLSELECLQCWGSGFWQIADSPEFSFDLLPLDNLAELQPDEDSYVSESLLWEFLNTTAGNIFADPGNVIPPRWQQMVPEQRQSIFRRVFSAALDALDDPQSRLIVLCEPEIVAILFFGIFRLIPDLQSREPCSFSTFESEPDKITSTLSAFPLPESLRDSYDRNRLLSRGTVVDTYREEPSSDSSPNSDFSNLMVSRLLSSGWQEVEGIREGIRKAGWKRPSEWRSVISLHQAVDQLLAPDPPSSPDLKEITPKRMEYLRNTLFRSLKQYVFPSDQLAFLVESRNHVPLLDLICRDVELQPEVSAVADFLIETLSEKDVVKVVHTERIAASYRLKALTEYLIREGRVPAGFEELWQGKISVEEGSKPKPILAAALDAVLRSGDVPSEGKRRLTQVLQHIPAESYADFFKCSAFGDSWKQFALKKYYIDNGSLPPGCEFMWGDATQSPAPVILWLLGQIETTYSTDKAADLLLSAAPEPALDEILTGNTVSLETRGAALADYMKRNNRLPKTAKKLWALRRTKSKRPPDDSVLCAAISRVEHICLSSVIASLDGDTGRRCRMVRFLQHATAQTKNQPKSTEEHDFPLPAAWSVGTPLVALQELVNSMSYDEVMELYRNYGEQDVFRFHPDPRSEPKLPYKVRCILERLFYDPEGFRERLNMIEAAAKITYGDEGPRKQWEAPRDSGFLTSDARLKLTKWQTCLHSVQSLSRLENQQIAERWLEIVANLAGSFYELVPEDNRGLNGAQRLDRLREIAQDYLGKPFLDPSQLHEGRPTKRVENTLQKLEYALKQGGGMLATYRKLPGSDWLYTILVIVFVIVLIAGLAFVAIDLWNLISSRLL